MIDYTGKLNEHEKYIEMLNVLDKDCDYIEVVIVDGSKNNHIVNRFNKDVISYRSVSMWWCTVTKKSHYLFKIKYTRKLLEYLKTFETFCKYHEYGSNEETLRRGDYGETTDFGMDDIAFYDKNGRCLLSTTTHEGYVSINSELVEGYF